ncbi:head GIN domain-containing protein [Bernardetia sp.]|uniref:head GIN domain-containing protein n=1 Tax=Bernardetia sp. TaxID=1937974 RepID=UPI0025C07568|nr:head GIN domain-containing protein [Bernardetia sp.]
MKHQFKIYLLPFIFLFLSLSSCSIVDTVCKDGTGQVISEQRNITGFSAIESKGSFTVHLFQDASITTQEVTVSAQESIINLIQTNLVGQSLIIDTDECYNTNEEVVITVRTPALSQIVLTGSGDIVLQDTVRKSEIEIVLEGSGNISTTPNFPIIASTRCLVTLKGSGNIELEFDNSTIINTALDGSGNITLRGEATENTLNVSGSGNIKAFDLPVLISTAELIGSGNIELTANDPNATSTNSDAEINAQLSGSGTIYVKGNGNMTSNVSGSGKIERVE